MPPGFCPILCEEAAPISGVDFHALCLPQTERRGQSETIIVRVGVSAIFGASIITDTADAPTRELFSACFFFIFFHAGDLDFLSLVCSEEGTLITEGTELRVSAEELF